MFDLDNDLSQLGEKSYDVSPFSTPVCFSLCSFPYPDFQQPQTGKDSAEDSALCEAQALHVLGSIIRDGAREKF